MLPLETLPFWMFLMLFMLSAMWRSTGFKQWRLLFCLLRLWRIRMMTMTATTRSVTMRAERVPTMIPIMSFSVVASFVWTERSSTCCCESEKVPNPKALNQVRWKIKSYSLVGTGTFACFIIQLLFKILPCPIWMLSFLSKGNLSCRGGALVVCTMGVRGGSSIVTLAFVTSVTQKKNLILQVSSH